MTPSDIVEKIKKKLSESSNPKIKAHIGKIQQTVLTGGASGTEITYAVGLYLKEIKVRDVESFLFAEKEIEEYFEFCRTQGGMNL